MRILHKTCHCETSAHTGCGIGPAGASSEQPAKPALGESESVLFNIVEISTFLGMRIPTVAMPKCALPNQRFGGLLK